MSKVLCFMKFRNLGSALPRGLIDFTEGRRRERGREGEREREKEREKEREREKINAAQET